MSLSQALRKLSIARVLRREARAEYIATLAAIDQDETAEALMDEIRATADPADLEMLERGYQQARQCDHRGG